MPKIDDYRSIVGEDEINELYLLAERLKGKAVQNINSTSVGGGVAEILSRMVPLLRELGVDYKWDVIKGDEKFFSITKNIHNAMHGVNIEIKDDDWKHFLEVNRQNAEEVDLSGDVVIIHDPQPIALIEKRSDFPEEMGLEVPYRHHGSPDRCPEFFKTFYSKVRSGSLLCAVICKKGSEHQKDAHFSFHRSFER